MSEFIGEVRLNLDRYSGRDMYCDGTVEDEILKIVQEHNSEEYDRIIGERLSWPIFYHLSHIRENSVNWLDISKEQTVLEIGSGCGAVTGALAKKARSVTCVELSKKRSMVNAYRHKNFSNIEIRVGNFEEIEPELDKYDVVTLIGVLEYSKLYIHSDKPFVDMLIKAKAHLKQGGKLVIAIENKLGLKYWAGCKEDHVGRYFESIEGYPNNDGIETFSYKELKGLIEQAGFGEQSFYYPYPDYKFPDRIYSDGYLPKKGDLYAESKNFDNDRLALFNEGRAYDTIIENGLFREFSNSFIVVAV